MELTLLALQNVMLSAMTGNLTLAETMYALASEIERIAPDIVVSTVRLDDDRRMRPLAAPSLSASYEEAINGVLIGPDVGTFGPAMTLGRAVLTRDIVEDPNWRSLLDVVEPLGLRACWAHPIKDRNERVLGSLAFYFRQPGEPSDAQVRLAQACLPLCALAFEYEQTHNALQRLAWFDTLTSLPNRAMLEREAERILAQARRARSTVSVLMIDVDHFKRHNDTQGHLAGDKALRLIANCIAGGALRPGDIAGRYGGEEFCVVLPDADRREAIDVAECIRLKVEQDLQSPGAGTKGLTVSIGVSVFDGNSDDSFEDLIERADQCLYEAKRRGRNRVIAPRPVPRDPPADIDAMTDTVNGLEMRGATELEDIAHLYGDDLAPELASLSEALAPITGTIVDEFYRLLGTLPRPGKLIRSLSPSELYSVKRRQAENLMLVVSPGLTSAQHRAVSLKMGRLHAIFGLSVRDVAHAQELLHAAVSRHVDAAAHQVALATLSRRLTRDLIWQIEGSRLMRENFRDVLLRMTELAWSAPNHADLIGKAAAVIGGLDGIIGCSFGRPGIEGIFRFEAASGERVRAYLAEIDVVASTLIMKGDGPQGQGPTGRAWMGGQIERCINIETDHRMTPWREAARRYGIRSTVAIPLSPPDLTPGTVLSLYCELPGGYTSAEQNGFVRQLQAVLTFAIARLESGSRTQPAPPWHTRQRWANLIRTQALEMHYQPIMDLVSGDVTHAEALVRLRDGERMLAPGSFFACLSREDFVVVYTQGLRQVLDQQNRWLRDGLDMMVSVNLPAEALDDPRYYEITREALRRYSGRPQRLMLEVLETPGVVSRTSERDGLDKFRALGIRLAEDDMGAGHSSLDRLRALPFDVIKLDRSLVLGVERTPIDVLSSIYQLTNLCHALGKAVVVEGAESADLVDAVALLGADAVQGYAIAPPLPAAQFADWKREHGEAYAAPDHMNPRGYLAKLAKLLIWETHLSLLFGAAQSRVYELPLESAPILPFRHVDAALQTALHGAAMTHGIHSAHYRAAREKVIEALSA